MRKRLRLYDVDAERLTGAKLREGTGHPREAAGVADVGLTRHPIDMAIPRTGAAIFHLAPARLHASGDLAGVVQTQLSVLACPGWHRLYYWLKWASAETPSQ